MRTVLVSTLLAVTACANESKPQEAAIAPEATVATVRSDTTATSNFVSEHDCATIVPKVAIVLAAALERDLRVEMASFSDEEALAEFELGLAAFPAKMPGYTKALFTRCITDQWPKEFGTCLATANATNDELLKLCWPPLPTDKSQLMSAETIKFWSL